MPSLPTIDAADLMVLFWCMVFGFLIFMVILRFVDRFEAAASAENDVKDWACKEIADLDCKCFFCGEAKRRKINGHRHH